MRAEATDPLALQSLEVILRYKPTLPCSRTSSLVVFVVGIEAPRTLVVSGRRTALSGEDADADGQADACDACPLDANDDADDDGACANVDNCPAVANRDQADADLDGTGDACQVVACVRNGPSDSDNDGICTPADNCPANANANQLDGDSDGAGDACDACTKGGTMDPDNNGVCEPVAPATPQPGVYTWTRLNLPAANLVAVDFAPDGSFFVALEAYNVVHIVDWATKVKRTFDLKGSGIEISWESLRFDPHGGFAILAGSEFKPSCCAAILWRLDVASAKDPQKTQADIFSKWTNSRRPGEEAAAIRFPFGTGNPVLLTQADTGNAYVARLLDFDATAGSYVNASTRSTATGAGCQDFAFVTGLFDQPAIAVTCGVNGGQIWLWSSNPATPSITDWALVSTNGAGNVSRIDSHPLDKYALAPNWSSSSPNVYRVSRGQFSTAWRFPLTRVWGVRFQQLGQRALFFGDSLNSNGAYVAPVWEYRHPNATMAQVTAVGITGFNVAPWPATQTASQWNLADLAFRPGCDGGVLVGGRSDFSSSTGFLAKFQIENGTACP